MISREHTDSMAAMHAERRAELSVQAVELAGERSHIISTMSALDAGDLACEDDVVALLRREDVTPNEVGRAMLRLRNEWAQRVAERMMA